MKTETQALAYVITGYDSPRVALTLQTAKEIQEEMQRNLNMMGSSTFIKAHIVEVILED